MFTVSDIENAHKKVKSGADFPKYIQEIKQFGVTSFETSVVDSHTKYFGNNDYSTTSNPKYEPLEISEKSDKAQFIRYLKSHQKGETNYFVFCQHCAETGINKWIVRLDDMTCTYYDISDNSILLENIPS